MVIRLLKKTVSTLTVASLLVADIAWAGGPVADPAAAIGFRPTVQTAPNGVPTVNIVNPSAGGVSHNKYTSFDVENHGAVLNNSMVAGTSGLAGALAANPNLTAPASVILNEVTGNSASSLAGPTEVFGTAANVIVANPNGVSVNGASFINAPRVTLTTGTPTSTGSGTYDGLGFSVQDGQVSVSGAGLDASGATQVDMYGRRVSIDGAVTGATQLNVVGGGADILYGTGAATGAAAPAATGSYAIDATALGAMNAGAVKLIGTEAGLGVRALGGVAANAGQVTITSTGEIVLSGATATGAVALSGTNVSAGGTIAAGGDLTVAASQAAATSGAHSAQSVVITAGTSATLGGSVTAGTDLNVTAGTAVTVDGTVAADGNASVNAAAMNVSAPGALTAGGSVAIATTGAVANAGVLDAGADMTVTAASLDNTGRASAATALSVTTTGGVTNTSGQMAGAAIAITAGGALTNTTGSITGANAVTVTAASVGNRQGFLRSTDAGVSVTSTGALDNTQGAIGGTDITLTAGALDNSAGEAIATGNLAVATTTGALVNKGGTLFASGTTTLTSAAGIDNTAQGSAGAVGQMSVAAADTIDNTGGTLVTNEHLNVTTAGQVVQGGSMTAATGISASAGSFTNKGYTASAATLAVSAATLTNESGQIAANDGVTLAATGALDNRAQISSGQDVSLSAATLSNTTTGRIEANRDLTAAATAAMTNAGIMAANGNVALTAGAALTNARGTVLSGGAMTLQAGTAFTNEAGTIQAGTDLAVIAGTRIDNKRGPVNGTTNQSESTGAATLSANGALLLQAPVVRNEASLIASGGAMTINASTFENVVHNLLWRTTYSWQSCSRTWYGKKKCHTNYGYSDSYTQTPSLVYAGGTLALTAGAITNSGSIQANRVNAVANVLTNGLVDWTVKTMPAAVPAARIDLTQYAALPEGTPGLFDLSRDPASRYVVTTTVNVANLVDPEALNARLGQAAALNPRFFADPFAEAALLARAALAETGRRFFVPDVTTDEQQRTALYDNAAAFAATRTDVKLGVAFTDAQIEALAKPILWYVDTGAGVLAPTVYLPQLARENLIHQEGGRIVATDADLLVAGSFRNTGFVTVADTLTIDAGAIVNEQRIARDTVFRTAQSKGRTSLHAVELNALQAGGEITGGSVDLRAAGDLSTSGGRLLASRRLDIEAGGDVTLAAARVENHERVNAGKAGWEIDSATHHAALVAAGLELSVLAGGDVTVAGAKLQGGGDVSVRALGDVALAAAVDEYSSHIWSKKRGSKTDGTLETTRNQKAEIASTGGDVTITSGADLAIQASRVAAAGDIALDAGGTLALLSGSDTTYAREKREKSGLVWQSTQDKGETATTVAMTELEAGGALSVAAGNGIIVDYRDAGSLEASLAALAQDPRTKWVAEIAQRDDVTWRAVNEAYTSWDHKTQGLSGPAAIVIAIAVTIATQGAGAALLGAAGATSAAAAGTVTAAMANAGFAALVSQASISLINNRGDLGAVLKELGSAQTVKNLAVAVATAGLTQGIADGLKLDQSLTASLTDRVAHQAVKAGVGVAVNSTIGGADFADAIAAGGLSMATAMASQTLFQGIGDLAADLKIEEGDLRKVIAHALAGCAAGQITRNCVGGAIGAGLQELAGGAINQLNSDPARQVQLSGLIAATATMLVGGDADAVSAANTIAQDARTYNRQLHTAELQKLKELAPEFARQQNIDEGEALRRLLAAALRNVDETYAQMHAGWDQYAEGFLMRNASGTITVAGREALMFTANGAEKADPTLLADSWTNYRPEFLQAYAQTPIAYASDRFAVQQQVLDAYLDFVGLLPYGGNLAADLVRYDQARRSGDADAIRDAEQSLLLDLLPTPGLPKKGSGGTKTLDDLAQTDTATEVYGRIIDVWDLSHLPGRQNGKLGEQIGLLTLEEQTGLKFTALQNASGHGADGVAIDEATQTIYVAEVKSSQNGVTQAARAQGDVERKLEEWIRRSANKIPPWGAQSPDNAALVEAIKQAEENNYQIKGIQVQVGIPAPGTAGTPQIVIKPW